MTHVALADVPWPMFRSHDRPPAAPLAGAGRLVWPMFRGHKMVEAAPIGEIVEYALGLHILVKPYRDDRVAIFRPSPLGMIGVPKVGDYAVIHDDGFKSIMGKSAFEEGFTGV